MSTSGEDNRPREALDKAGYDLAFFRVLQMEPRSWPFLSSNYTEALANDANCQGTAFASTRSRSPVSQLLDNLLRLSIYSIHSTIPVVASRGEALAPAGCSRSLRNRIITRQLNAPRAEDASAGEQRVNVITEAAGGMLNRTRVI